MITCLQDPSVHTCLASSFCPRSLMPMNPSHHTTFPMASLKMRKAYLLAHLRGATQEKKLGYLKPDVFSFQWLPSEECEGTISTPLKWHYKSQIPFNTLKLRLNRVQSELQSAGFSDSHLCDDTGVFTPAFHCNSQCELSQILHNRMPKLALS